MYVDTCKTGKYVRFLLRDCYRENGKIKHHTIANLSGCSEAEIDAIKLAFKHKDQLANLISISEDMAFKQGKSVGAVWTIFTLAKRLGIVDALGSTQQAKLALWQIIARVIDQGSRLSAVRLAGTHAACDIINLEGFNEENLYKNLDWLADNQVGIEDRLFLKAEEKGLFLYDVTSSYLEGTHNEYAAFGYNRDGKKGKRQIVIGLLCNSQGRPLSIEVFDGNTQDTTTVASQVEKISERFGGGDITLVGDRGMIKNKQMQALGEHEFHYITAITKPQIQSLLDKGIIQLGLFDHELAEVSDNDCRYILRRNPVRALEIGACRADKLNALQREVAKSNDYLRVHGRASVDVAVRKIEGRVERLRLSGWVTLNKTERELSICVNEESLQSEAELDGCYVLKTDLTPETASKETIHGRYKDLALVEMAFRTSKTVELEMRPIHVRLASRTRGHVLVVMLSYLIVRELASYWRSVDLTVAEGIRELSTLCSMDILVKNKAVCTKVPQPSDVNEKLLSLADIKLPAIIPSKGVAVATRKKLTERRKT